MPLPPLRATLPALLAMPLPPQVLPCRALPLPWVPLRLTQLPRPLRLLALLWALPLMPQVPPPPPP